MAGELQNFAGTAGGKGGKALRLGRPIDLRKYAGRVLRDLQANSQPGDVQAARVKLYGVQVIAQIIRDTELDARLKKLESAAAADARRNEDKQPAMVQAAIVSGGPG